MREILQMDRIMEKLTILSAAARYDVACTSSGVQRGGDGTHTGNAYASGICHAFTGDGAAFHCLRFYIPMIVSMTANIAGTVAAMM